MGDFHENCTGDKEEKKSLIYCNFLLQTVLNTMCGYGMQQLEERSAGQDVFTIGCLEKIVWWVKNNLLLVAGLTAGLLLLEVTPDTTSLLFFTINALETLSEEGRR